MWKVKIRSQSRKCATTSKIWQAGKNHHNFTTFSLNGIHTWAGTLSSPLHKRYNWFPSFVEVILC